MFLRAAQSRRRQVTNIRSRLIAAKVRRAAVRAAGNFIEALEKRQLLSIVTPAHIVVMIEEDRAANAIGDTADMPYFNQLAASGLVYSNSHALNTTSQEGQMNYLALFSGSTQGVTQNAYAGPFSGGNLAQSLNNSGLSFSGYAEAMPHDGDTTDAYAASPTNPAYDDLYQRAYNPMAQFTKVGTGKTNAQVNKTFASFPTTAAGYSALPTVSFVIPDTLDNAHGSNDTDPYATDPSEYNFLRQSADTWLKNNLGGYVQWAQQNNSILIVTGDEGDRAHGFTSLATNNVTTIVVGDPRIVVPGTDATSINPYNLLRTIEDMYGLTPLGSTATASDVDVSALGQLAPPVAQTASSTALGASANPSVFGQNVTFTATVSGSGSLMPTGTVTFKDGTTSLGTGTLNASGVATFTTSALSAATHSITAAYGGDTNFLAGGSAALSETVQPASTAIAVTSSAVSSAFGQSVTFTATVADVAPGAGTAAGTVQFMIDGSNLGSPIALVGGSATSNAITSLAVGAHTVGAVYGGASSFLGSTSSSMIETVNQASTATLLISSANPAVFGQGVTFTATVAPTGSGAGVPTGSVTFADGSTILGTGILNASEAATFTTSSLLVASHSIIATYAGDTNFSTSGSTVLTQLVSSATVGTTTALISSASPAVFGQAVNFTATVAAVSGSNKPTGTVMFKDGSTTLGTATLNASGVGTFATSSLGIAVHSITAVYSGGASFAASTSSALSQTVDAASAVTTISSSASGKSIVTPSHVVIVVLSSHASNEVGDTANMPYLNSLAANGLVYSNSHGVSTPSQGTLMNYLALYSGSTQGVTTDNSSANFSGLDLGDELNAQLGVGNGFVGYTESLPSDGSQALSASGTAQGKTFADAYNRDFNPVAMFDAGTNAQVNRTFAEFPTNYASLPAVSFVLPNMLDSTHGSNVQAPWAGSNDATNNNQLKQWSDSWLKQNLNAYVQWARQNNSLLIITSAVGDKANGFTSLATNNLTTIIDGAANLVVPGTDTTSITPYNLLRTVEDMYGLAPLGSTAAASDVDTNSQGQLAPTAQPGGQAIVGQSLTFTASVAAAAPGAGVPTGTVQFTIDGVNIGSPVTLVNGVATSLPVNSLGAGSHVVSAVYGGDANFVPGGVLNITQTVGQASTSTTVNASAPSGVLGQSVTLTATVAVTAPGSGAPTGTVTFKNGSTVLGTSSVNASGIATLTTSTLALGSHPLTASYGGDSNFLGSASAILNETVNQAATTTVVTSSSLSSSFGQPVTLTATVAPLAPGAGTPTGTVQFVIDGTNFGSPIAISGGSVVSMAISSLAVGSHTVLVLYSGDSNFVASTSANLIQTVS